MPIPSLHHIPSGRAILDADSLSHVLSVLEEKGVGHWWDGPVDDFVPVYLRDGETGDVASVWKKGTDTMDVWFDSGSSWALFDERGVRSETPGRKAYADVCLEGSDQHRGWFQSLLLTSIATQEDGSNGEEGGAGMTLPYRTVITHGMVLDEAGKKMSKSDGNVVSPMVIVNGGKVRWFRTSILREMTLITIMKPRTNQKNRPMARTLSASGLRPSSRGGTCHLARDHWRRLRKR